MNPEDFATKKIPLRSSKLQDLAACTLKAVVSLLPGNDEEVGQAADTGSATHKAIETWHKQKKDKRDTEAAIREMQKNIDKYSKADLIDAANMFLSYTQDPRNKEAEVILTEKKIEIELEPADFDPTKKKIIILGTLDQVRRINGRLYVWDVKTGNRPPSYMKSAYCLQLGAYTLGATKELGETVYPGGFIRTRGYQRKRPPVDPSTCPADIFIDVDFNRDDIDPMLEIIRHKVALVRMGKYSVTSGEQCSWCTIGLSSCPSLLQQLSLKSKHGKENSKPEKRRNKTVNSTINPFESIGSIT